MSFRVASAAVMLSLVTVVVCARGQNASSDWQPARPAYAWSFPRDHAAHPGYRNEWWYFVGHLEDDAGRRYGYQLTLFRIGIAPAPPGWNSSWDASDIAMGHLAITEIDADPGRHTFAEAVHRATRALGGFGTGVGAGVGDGDTLAWCQAPAGSRGRWTVRLAPPTGDSLGTAFDLD
ncbi:MAG: hypothetical protein KC729_08430, partial [Candidatus Eisenbacteria bacterium]|nr:hypothetical protein [Candidatus Eisenbacteria bacterium]